LTSPGPAFLRSLSLLAALLLAGPAAASPMRAFLDPAQSSLDGAALSGFVDLEVGDGVGNRSFDVTRLAISGAGLDVGLDPTLTNPGLGLLRTDGTFLIPALFVVIEGLGDPLALTLIDVAGTFAPCGATAHCLASAFQIDTGGAEGVLDVQIDAVVPEPGTALLLALGLAGVGVARRGRSACGPRRIR